eukprot:TRINITY_DN13534_c0_g1_i1.p1 TRINITY_DN13534_c0_g1~~TRINITY_DN13534_c0_g1_i1.p1  ORF type:complete len:101 (-),score=15.87 TRINITY_DN13534_c0_g1_i1:33-335(-)
MIEVSHTFTWVKIVAFENFHIEFETKNGLSIANLVRDYYASIKLTAIYARAVKTIVSTDEAMLNFQIGQIIEIVDRDESSTWFVGKYTNEAKEEKQGWLD